MVRQEPDVYVNGQPVCARPPNKIGEYAELGAITRDIVKKGELEQVKEGAPSLYVGETSRSTTWEDQRLGEERPGRREERFVWRPDGCWLSEEDL